MPKTKPWGDLSLEQINAIKNAKKHGEAKKIIRTKYPSWGKEGEEKMFLVTFVRDVISTRSAEIKIIARDEEEAEELANKLDTDELEWQDNYDEREDDERIDDVEELDN